MSAPDSSRTSWADCRDMWHEMWSQRARRVEVKLVPPIRRIAGDGWSAWCVVAVSRPRHEGEGREISATISFGPRGAYATAPAAVLAALAELWTRHETLEAAVAEQQRLPE